MNTVRYWQIEGFDDAREVSNFTWRDHGRTTRADL